MRRSLAIAGSLTRADTERLLDTCAALLAERSAIAGIFDPSGLMNRSTAGAQRAGTDRRGGALTAAASPGVCTGRRQAPPCPCVGVALRYPAVAKGKPKRRIRLSTAMTWPCDSLPRLRIAVRQRIADHVVQHRPAEADDGCEEHHQRDQPQEQGHRPSPALIGVVGGHWAPSTASR